jgi:hypothetical protein
MLRDDWSGLSFFKRMTYEPVMEDYGSYVSGNIRTSRRLYLRRLLTASASASAN